MIFSPLTRRVKIENINGTFPSPCFSPRVSPEVMTVSLSASALITVLETLTENDLKWLIKSQKCWRRIKTCFLLTLYDCRPVVLALTINIFHPVAD